MRKTTALLALPALMLLSACSASNSEGASSSAAASSTSASASPSPSTVSPSTASPSAEPTPTEEAPAPEVTEEASPSQEPSAEPSPVEPYPGYIFAERGVTFFVPDGYSQDQNPSQSEIFVYQFTHYKEENPADASGRIMVGTPFTVDEGKTVEDLEKEALERLTPAWQIKETLDTVSYSRADGVQVIRTEVRFASGNHPGYVFTFSQGQQMMHAAILVDDTTPEFLQKIENSIGFAQ